MAKEKKIPRMPRVGECKYKPEYRQRLWKYFMTYDGRGIPQMSAFAREIGVDTKTLRNWRTAYEDFGVVYEACMEYQQELLNIGGLTGEMNPRMVQFMLSANHKVREYTRINTDERGAEMAMSAADQLLLTALEERLANPPTAPVIVSDMVNEGAVPYEEADGHE